METKSFKTKISELLIEPILRMDTVGKMEDKTLYKKKEGNIGQGENLDKLLCQETSCIHQTFLHSIIGG